MFRHHIYGGRWLPHGRRVSGRSSGKEVSMWFRFTTTKRQFGLGVPHSAHHRRHE